MKLFGIVGAGGFGREVMPLAQLMLQKSFEKSSYELVFIDEEKFGSWMNGVKVMRLDDFENHQASEKYFNITIADSQVRQRIATEMIERNIQAFSITSDHSLNLGFNKIEEGAIFCAYTQVTVNAKIGKFFHANIYSYIAHDCVIGDYVTFAPNVHCNGNVIIEDHVYVGTGVIIKQGTTANPVVIGKGAILGMGAVVTKSVMAGETVVGNPARLFVQKQNQVA